MKKRIIIAISFILVLVGSLLVVYNYAINRDDFEKKASDYEQKYLSTKSEVDLINLVYFLENSEVLDERRIKYSGVLIDKISLNGIEQSEMKDYYDSLPIDNPQVIPISFYVHDLLCLEQYDIFSNEFAKYYPNLSHNDRLILSSLVVETYKNAKKTQIVETSVIAYSKIAKNTKDELIVNECLSQIVSIKNAIEYVDGKAISIDNEILRSMTIDGEYIPITAKGKTIKYYSVTTGDYVSNIHEEYR